MTFVFSHLFVWFALPSCLLSLTFLFWVAAKHNKPIFPYTLTNTTPILIFDIQLPLPHPASQHDHDHTQWQNIRRCDLPIKFVFWYFRIRIRRWQGYHSRWRCRLFLDRRLHIINRELWFTAYSNNEKEETAESFIGFTQWHGWIHLIQVPPFKDQLRWLALHIRRWNDHRSKE